MFNRADHVNGVGGNPEINSSISKPKLTMKTTLTTTTMKGKRRDLSQRIMPTTWRICQLEQRQMTVDIGSWIESVKGNNRWMRKNKPNY